MGKSEHSHENKSRDAFCRSVFFFSLRLSVSVSCISRIFLVYIWTKVFLSVFNGAFLCSSFHFYGNEWFHSQYLYTHSFQFGYYDTNCCCCPVGFFMMIICLIGAYVLPGFEGAIFYSIYSRLRFAVDLTNHEKIDMRAVGAYVVPMTKSI